MNKEMDLIGVPLELGADRKGISRGPAAIRNAGLIERLNGLGIQVHEKGDVFVPPPPDPEDEPAGLKHLSVVRQVNDALCEAAAASAGGGRFPLVLGGDHSLALGTLAGVSRKYRNLGVIWIDAHGDMNTDQTTPSGHIHGMPLAASMGFGHPNLTSIGGCSPKIHPKRVVLIGVRSLDPGESKFIQEHGVRLFTSDDVRRMGMEQVMKQAISIAGEGTDGIHLSFDLDVLDPAVAPGVSTPVPGGLTRQEAETALTHIRRSGRLVSAEFVEVNPELDHDHATALAAVELIVKLFE